MTETLKSKVLAKCGELEKGRQENGWTVTKSPLRAVSKYCLEDEDGLNFITIDDTISEYSWKWAAAAQILGITQPVEQPERPCNELLRKAFGKGYSSYLTPLKEAETLFSEWLSTLPADPLEADREIVRTEFANGLERSLIDAYCTGDAIAALKRFAGLEVGNG